MNFKLHNAMWPGLVGKEPNTDHPPISLDRMLELTVNASVNGQKVNGVDLFLFHPHIDPGTLDGTLDKDQIKRIADKIAAKNLAVGSLVAPVWAGTLGASAMGSAEDRKKFVGAVERACEIAQVLNDHGVRQYGVIRIDSADNPANWALDPKNNTRQIATTFRQAGNVAADYGERLAAEGEICWAGMHSWKHMVELLELVGMPNVVGFQADLAHTYLYLLGCNAPEHESLLKPNYIPSEFWRAYATMTNALGPWTIDFHVAQNDGSVHGTGNHERTGRHCLPNDPNGKLDMVTCTGYWLKDAESRGIQHVCWDGCMFPNAVLENPQTWRDILKVMLDVRNYFAKS